MSDDQRTADKMARVPRAYRAKLLLRAVEKEMTAVHEYATSEEARRGGSLAFDWSHMEEALCEGVTRVTRAWRRASRAAVSRGLVQMAAHCLLIAEDALDWEIPDEDTTESQEALAALLADPARVEQALAEFEGYRRGRKVQ